MRQICKSEAVTFSPINSRSVSATCCETTVQKDSNLTAIEPPQGHDSLNNPETIINVWNAQLTSRMLTPTQTYREPIVMSGRPEKGAHYDYTKPGKTFPVDPNRIPPQKDWRSGEEKVSDGNKDAAKARDRAGVDSKDFGKGK